MNSDDGEEELDMPRFECNLPIPEEITGSNRMLLQQVSILRQEIAFVHKKGNLGRRAWTLAKANESAINRLYRFYWVALGGLGVIQIAFKFLFVK